MHVRNIIIALCAVTTVALTGCTNGETGPVNMTEIECRLNSDCDIGSYCDTFTSLCGWDCRNDAECGTDMYCDLRNGRCLREEMPPLPPDMSAVLEIEAGPMEDLTVLGGTTDAEFVRLALANRSERPIGIPMLPTTFDPLTGFSLGGVLGEVKIRDERDRSILMGPIDLTGALIRLENVFSDSFEIQPGEEIILAVRADVHATNRTEFDLVLGTPSGALLTGLRYADTGEAVPMNRVANNFSIVRHINVQPEETVVPPLPTDVGMVTVSMAESGTIAFIDASPTLESAVAHIDLANGLDRQVSYSNLRIRASRSDGSPWSPDGGSPLRAFDVMDGHGSWRSGVPGESSCDVDGCTFTFEGATLEAGESMRLTLLVAISDPGDNLHFDIGNTVMFQHITYMPGADVPVARVDGNFEGSLTVISR